MTGSRGGVVAARVAQIQADHGDGTATMGSGYLMTDDLVLTARHVIDRAASTKIFFEVDPRNQRTSSADVAWMSQETEVDLALLRLLTSGSAQSGSPRFARLPTDRAAHERAIAVGFPLWKWRQCQGHVLRDSHQADGTIGSLSSSVKQTYEFVVKPPGENPPPAGSKLAVLWKERGPWQGMSGAAVFAAGHVVGVVRQVHPLEGPGRLDCLRIECVLHAGDGSGRTLAQMLGAGDPAALPYVVDGAVESMARATAAVRGPTLDLTCRRVPAVGKPSDGPYPVDDRYLTDLGAVLGIDRRPSMTVVAARPGQPFAFALDDLEATVVRPAAAAASDVLPRSWREVDLAAGEDDLRDVADAAHGLGAVVTVAASAVGDHGALVRRLRDRLAALSPATPAVIVVEDRDPVTAISGAVELACELHRATPGPVDLLAHVCPGSGEPGTQDGTALPSDEVEHRVAAVSGMVSTALAGGWPPPPRELAALSAVDAATIAVGVVEHLGRAAVAPLAEKRALLAVRDLAPDLFPALLRAHASGRSWPARWASLSAAAGIDAHADLWLAAVGDLDEAGSIPRQLRDGRLVESLVVAQLRRGDRVSARWRTYVAGRNPALSALVEHLAMSAASSRASSVQSPVESDAEFLQAAGAEVGTYVMRAGLDALALTQLESPHTSMAWWAMAGRSRLTQRTIKALADLAPAIRGAVGFVGTTTPVDSGFAALAEQIASTFRPRPVLLPAPRREPLPVKALT